jgi:DNA helicase II / ATP-dependent DNA helicase PcrA
VADGLVSATMVSGSPGAAFDDLNPEQRRAVEAVRGPVVILAGAGSGKTTTITRRIANQVLSDVFAPTQILAVTFTDKAAGEMRTRLGHLRVTGVNTRTFHSAAYAQLRYLSPGSLGEVIASKVSILRPLAQSLPVPYRFRPVGDLATEVEWARNRRITSDGYLDSLRDHEPPIPADLMSGVYRNYERRKSHMGFVDFEDLLELAIRMYEDDRVACETFRNRYAAFTVDEFQDVNLLQYTLLMQWLGGREDLCAVGDDYQSIFGFTGATPNYLLELPRRLAGARVFKLETNYRSTPEVLELANRLTPALGGALKSLRSEKETGPRPEVRTFADEDEEARFVAASARELHKRGVPYESMAVLYRIGFRSETYSGGFVEMKVPFQVRDGAFLARPAARRLLSLLRGSDRADVGEGVRKTAVREGWQQEPDENLSERELTRQQDWARLIRLAEEFDDGVRSGAQFADDLVARFSSEGEGRGVNLLTYHRAKGLEFDAVFLPRLNEGELPYKRSFEGEALAEERRLLYVGITRARRYLVMSHLSGRSLRPSRFLEELAVVPKVGPGAHSGRESPAATALRRWRLDRARAAGVPAYVVFNDRTLDEIAKIRPRTKAELASVSGMGPLRVRGYGEDILRVLNELPE